ncbi:hypothetical protein C486_06518 [Natrinema gari JCM 14663]|uniref:Uncharacterized protein n=1 Tax=Natrinema gari JCM 14663 TaxID=1230459 RepID=L9Z6V4_9EURY|nr:hypothetical protein C486_06518 [Natrinema gari JCM 14663]
MNSASNVSAGRNGAVEPTGTRAATGGLGR